MSFYDTGLDARFVYIDACAMPARKIPRGTWKWDTTPWRKHLGLGKEVNVPTLRRKGRDGRMGHPRALSSIYLAGRFCNPFMVRARISPGEPLATIGTSRLRFL